ncbi:mitochondrial distribution and morphology protein 34 [Kwoniella dejecticola CBS 10117]|uniref:Mitochondrial distribution and morphology protein 34 n=1 Tax=Kwoniella dejecticola CBS 10117 TaxID=1296121 RepID=A0A1A5ZXI1_9TREE|nr:mitochondrial distribution and morphology protein 34 [Kwoniella dejecticola CBS 10117]OBR82515.1 mitochondrial distribution and morphology protein 34 [Kwoniella dejecticola CBS 10117]
MSFVFPSWSTAFSPAFHEDAKAMLEGALNKGNKPPVIQGRIEVVELSMGKEPPTLTLLEIGDLSLDRFRGILRLGYSGDAWLEVRCRVQANPLSHNPNLSSSSTLPLSTPLLASQPLLVPMTLRLSKLHLRAILILVVSASKGITLVFKNDPLQNVDVSSTFDSVEVIRGYLQQEIEGQLREMFREDLPGIIHRLSQRWFHGTGVGGKVETPYRDIGVNETIPEDEREREEDEVDHQNPYAEPAIFPPHPSTNPEKFNTPRKQALARSMRARRPSTSGNSISESPTSYTTFPDIEDYDPTYGLRPEGVPTHSGYEAFGRLWEKSREGGNRGLGSLMSMPIQQDGDEGDYLSDEFDEDEEDDEDEVRSFDMVEMDDALRSIPRKSRRQSLMSAAGSRYGHANDDQDQMGWETFPAVGGGVITRPRVYHSQSLIRAPSEAGGGGAMPSPAGTATGGSVTARASSIDGASSTVGSLRMRPFTPSVSGVGLMSPTLSQAGPSSLRRMVTSRSDVFLSSAAAAQGSYTIPRSESFSAIPLPVPPPAYNRTAHRSSLSLSRRQSNAGGSSGTASASWDNSGPSRSNTLSTNPTSSIPSSGSKPLSISQPSKAQPQSQMHPLTRNRNSSISGTSPGTSFPPRNIGPGGITLPLNNSVSQLATLSHSAHTLSPYARGHEHIAVRSFPYLGRSNTGMTASNTGIGSSGLSLSLALAAGGNIPSRPGSSEGVIKARRKRIHRLTSTDTKKQEKEREWGNARDVRGLRENSAETINSGDIDEVDDSVIRSNSHTRKIRPMSYDSQPQSDVSDISRKIGLVALNTPGPALERRPNMRRNPDSRTSYGFPAL